MRQDPDATTTSERDSLGQYLDYQRETILLKAEGLTKEQLARKIPTSGLTLAGILYHLALVEEDWFEIKFLGHADREDFAGIDWAADPDYEFRTALEKEPDWLRRRYRDACNRARQVTAAAGSLDDASVSTLSNGKPFTLRWVMLHLIEETARHAGHADLLREAIDGTVGE
ncbi:MAG: DinB family protein [Trebonia sp.]